MEDTKKNDTEIKPDSNIELQKAITHQFAYQIGGVNLKFSLTTEKEAGDFLKLLNEAIVDVKSMLEKSVK